MNEVHAHPARPTSRPTAYRPGRRRRLVRVRRVLAAVLVAFVAVTGWSLSSALRAPGDDTVTKLAEWGRDHGLGPVVTLAESVQYRLNPPATGGTPDTSILAAGRTARAAPGTRRSQWSARCRRWSPPCRRPSRV